MANKTALVFGGLRGIGKATVTALRDAGWQVVYTARMAGGGAIVADIRDPASVAAAFDAAEAVAGGPVGCVVANAGINVPGKPLADFPAADFEALVATNLAGAFNVLQAAARRVADGGAIIGITTSLVGHVVAGTGPYTAGKAAVEALLRVAQKELAGRGVRVNGVAPGPVDTDLFRAGKDAAAVARMAGFSPFNRIGRPEEVAKVVAFLASDDASWVAGQIVRPNGGMV